MDKQENPRVKVLTETLQAPNLMPGFSPRVIASAITQALKQARETETAMNKLGQVAFCLMTGGSAYREGFMNLHYATERLPEAQQASRLADYMLN